MNKIDWFKSKNDYEWQAYFMSRIPMSKEDIRDLEDYTIWRVGEIEKKERY